MHSIFSVSSEDIKKLSDIQARELVARLCMSELRAKGIPTAGVIWGGDQRAKDGGVDVRVDINQPIDENNYLIRKLSAFQVKAESFAPSKIQEEMAPKGNIRPALKDLAKRRGAYIIVSTRDNLSDSSLKTRTDKMKECLTKYKLIGKVKIDFYDSRRLANWVEQHPGMVIWVKHNTGSPLVGWKPYGPWAYRDNNIDAEYVIDDRAKIFSPNMKEAIDVSTAIKCLREELNKNISIRLVGLSGVGKTRLIQALFDNRVCSNLPALDQNNVIYADLSDTTTPQPIVMVDELTKSGSDCVVVVDNCAPKEHQKLTDYARRPGSKLRLITVEYDIQDDQPDDTVCYRLEGSSDEIIKILVKRRYDFLSESDINKIAECSGGNARVAFALASTARSKDELGRLRDNQLFRRLFFQNNEACKELQRCAETASLVYSFDGDDTSINSEISTLAALAEVSNDTFRRNITELQKRGLVQKRGTWRAVLPQAIANHLASEAIENYAFKKLSSIFTDKASERMMRSFSRRLGYLHESDNAIKFFEEWLKPGGPLGNLNQMNEYKWSMFKNMAPLNEDITLAAIERELADKNFMSSLYYSKQKSELARLARSIAWDPKYFDRAVDMLLKLILSDASEHGNKSNRDILISLFKFILSGTETKAEQRSKVVRRLLSNSAEHDRQLGFELLIAALQTSDFMSSYGFEFGAHKRSYGWIPKTLNDKVEWYSMFIGIAVELGKNQTKIGRKARSILGKKIPSLWAAGLTDQIIMAAKEYKLFDGWPEGWVSVKGMLKSPDLGINTDYISKLLELEVELAPTDLRGQIKTKIIVESSMFDDSYLLTSEESSETDQGKRHLAVMKSAESLGTATANEFQLLIEMLPELIDADSSQKVLRFGIGVGESSNKVAKIIENSRKLIVNSKTDYPDLRFIRGLIVGWNRVKPHEVGEFLDHAINDKIWGISFPYLQLGISLDSRGYERLMSSLEKGIAPVRQYEHLGYGRATDPLSVKQVSELLNAILAKQGGQHVAIALISMVVHCANEKDYSYQNELKKYALSFLSKIIWSNILNGDGLILSRVENVLKFAITAPESIDKKLDVLKILVDFQHSEISSWSSKIGKLLVIYLEQYPRESLDIVYQIDNNGEYQKAVKSVSLNAFDNEETAIASVPTDILVEWCNNSPNDRFIFAAKTCCLFERSSELGEEKSISSASIQILAAAKEKNKIIEIFIDRFYPSSWSGSLSAILRERIPLLKDLNPENDPELETLIHAAQNELSERLKIELMREDKEDKQRSESFE